MSDIPAVTSMDYLTLERPVPGDTALRILSPTLLELQRINRKPQNTSSVDSWNLINADGNFSAPPTSNFTVRVNGQVRGPVTQVGFKRRVLSAPLVNYDIRIENALYLQLADAVPAGAEVVVSDSSGNLWSGSTSFVARNHPLRYSPAIHVNQDGYMPGYRKKATVGYYLGNLGEMDIPLGKGFELVHATTGAVVFSGNLTVKPDVGFEINPMPYQKVYQADFSAFNTPGEYYLVVPGLGASLPFLIDEGVAMKFTRTYALGLYHQRSGAPNEMPFTRFTHGGGHTDPVAVPSDQSTFAFTWSVISNEAKKINSNNPPQIAPQLTEPSAQLFPFINQGPLDITRGHHDAGDYSKYTINSASLIHLLVFGVDSLPGVGELDNLGLPESSDGISDILQLAKWEADFLAQMQDADGGFYFLVYPRNRRYESNVLPDEADPQVVWPKTTAATASAVAALAEIASSPRFKAAYPDAAAHYMEVAEHGWDFLMEAIDTYGKAGSYQKITHYGDDFTHDDELAWAAAAMFAATGDQEIHATLKSWYDPEDTSTWRWGWWRAYMGYGNALRSYAFAVESGRLPLSALDANYLQKSKTELVAAGDAALNWSDQSAYGTSFPDNTKRVRSAGWYFSSGQAFDITVAHQIEPKAAYIDAVIANMDYEGGANPVNVAYLTGLGRKRPLEIVHQYAQNDRRKVPPSGIPQGNLQTGPIYTSAYGTVLRELSFPADNSWTAPYPLYDRWSDTFNVATEFVHLDQARSLVSLAFLAAKSPLKHQAWRSGELHITGLPETLQSGTEVSVGLSAPGFDLSQAVVVWESADSPPAFGDNYSFTTSSYGNQWVEAEVTLPDGRRLFAVEDFFADNDRPNVSVVVSDAYAVIGSSTDFAAFTFTRSGELSAPLTVNFSLAGSASKWSDYRRPEGDMPEMITIPAGEESFTMHIRAIANSNDRDPLTLDVILRSGDSYNAIVPRLATAYLVDTETLQEGLPSCLKDSSPVIPGQWESDWFGTIYKLESGGGWFYSSDHGMIAIPDQQPLGVIWYWDWELALINEGKGFVYTTRDVYPYVYLPDLGWAYYYPDWLDQGMRIFYSIERSEWIIAPIVPSPLE